MENILSSIKTLLGVESTITAFDAELLFHINAAISELVQGGVGPDDGLTVTGTTNWEEFSDNINVIAPSREYVYCKTRLVWDPPSNSFVCTEISKRAEETYWRAFITSDELRKQASSNE